MRKIVVTTLYWLSVLSNKSMVMDMEHIICHMETPHNIHMDTNMDMAKECIISHMETLHGVYIHMKCQSVSTLHNIHTP